MANWSKRRFDDDRMYPQSIRDDDTEDRKISKMKRERHAQRRVDERMRLEDDGEMDVDGPWSPGQ